MPAVKQFDRNQGLERAMRVFWKRGYEATSIQELVDATRINRASLYATFGGKRELFLAALARYEEVVVKPLFEALADPEPRRGIERMFEALLRRMSDSSYPLGMSLYQHVFGMPHRRQSDRPCDRRVLRPPGNGDSPTCQPRSGARCNRSESRRARVGALLPRRRAWA